jgi:hypothetical protein
MDYHQNARLTIYRREQLARKVMEEGSTLAGAGWLITARARVGCRARRVFP